MDPASCLGCIANEEQVLLSVLLWQVPGIPISAAAPTLQIAHNRTLQTRADFGKAQFGNINGNFQPIRSSDENHTNQVVGPLAINDIDDKVWSIDKFDDYREYTGDGKVASGGWPNTTTWVSFEDMY